MKLRRITNPDGTFYAYAFLCPACNDSHIVTTAQTVSERQIPRWEFNGDMNKPTFSPSLRVQWTHGEKKIPRVCHSFLRNGNIEYCGDCTHELKGQTVELPEVE